MMEEEVGREISCVSFMNERSSSMNLLVVAGCVFKKKIERERVGKWCCVGSLKCEGMF